MKRNLSRGEQVWVVTQERQELSQGSTYTREHTEAGKNECCGSLNGFGTGLYNCALMGSTDREASENATWWSEPERSVADVGLLFSSLIDEARGRGAYASKGSHYTNINTFKVYFVPLKCVVFIGTPHKGAWTANWAKIPASTFSFGKSTNAKLLNVLQKDNQLLSQSR